VQLNAVIPKDFSILSRTLKKHDHRPRQAIQAMIALIEDHPLHRRIKQLL